MLLLGDGGGGNGDGDGESGDGDEGRGMMYDFFISSGPLPHFNNCQFLLSGLLLIPCTDYTDSSWSSLLGWDIYT